MNMMPSKESIKDHMDWERQVFAYFGNTLIGIIIAIVIAAFLHEVDPLQGYIAVALVIFFLALAALAMSYRLQRERKRLDDANTGP